jgi:alkylhydroperoxidase/carboxymuconolactone decarboxylase family protein YurZ
MPRPATSALRNGVRAVTVKATRERKALFAAFDPKTPGKPGLGLKVRQLVVVAACTTLGHAAPQLRAHVEGALSVGATKEEIVETILQTLFYACGAAVANALAIAKSVFEG